jgi:hypothetical protein
MPRVKTEDCKSASPIVFNRLCGTIRWKICFSVKGEYLENEGKPLCSGMCSTPSIIWVNSGERSSGLIMQNLVLKGEKT